ncbi:MFS transporter [Acetobacterium malicum]|uniref:MFS transporter n=1 Tax=Acetobacterium malicum TaxID=52692 RepID=UPI00040C7CBC|nr:MFS transporter [Acetobacterium dehalogenans]
MEQIMSKRKRNIVFLILSVAAGMAYFTPLLRFTFYDQMSLALSLNDFQMGMLSSVYAFSNTICYLPGGYLADKFSAKNLIITSLLGLTAITVWYAFTTDYNTLIVIHALFGVFAVGTFWSAYLKTIQSLGEEREQGRLFGISEALRGMGQTAVGFVCIWILSLFVNMTTGFTVLLFFNAAVYLTLAILTFFFVPADSKKTEKHSAEKNSQFKKFGIGIKSSSTWIVILVIMSGYALWALSNGYLTTYSVRVLGITPQTASALGIIRSYVIVFVAGIFGGVIMDKFTYKGKGFLYAFAGALALIVLVMVSDKVVGISIALTIVLTFITNVMKSTYWSTMGQAGIPTFMTAVSTGIISFIAYIPDFLIGPICGSWLDGAIQAGDIGIGFNKIFIFMIAWAILGIGSGILLLQRGKKTAVSSLVLKTELENGAAV